MDISFTQAASAYNSAGRMQGIVPSADSAIGTVASLPQEEIKPDFMDLVTGSLNKAIDVNRTAEVTSTQALKGETGINDLVTAIANAELTVNTVVAVRDRIISAYQDIIRMPV